MNGKKKGYAASKSRRNRYIAIALGCIVLLVLGCWALLGYSPRAYMPLTVSNPDEVSVYLTHQLGPDFYNQVQFNEAFELVFEQQGLNDIVSRWGWPRQFGEVRVETPVVLFETGRLYVMSRIGYGGMSSVLTVTARPEMDERGRLNVNIQSVRLGLLPVRGPAARIAEKAMDDHAAAFGDWPRAEANIRAIIANEPFEPFFDFDKQKIWIQQVVPEPGRLRVTLSPENKAVYKY